MVDSNTFMPRYLAWCESETRDELESGMLNLKWIGHPLFSFLVEYLTPKKPAEAAELFSAMLYRKLCHRGIEWRSELKVHHESILEEFEAASRIWNSRRMQDPLEALRVARHEVAKSSLIRRIAWEDLSNLGWEEVPWNPRVKKCSKRIGPVTLSTFLSSETKEFCYWQQLDCGDDRPLIDTSFAEWFGLGYYTIFAENSRGSEDKIAGFVVEKCQYFATEARVLLSGAASDLK